MSSDRDELAWFIARSLDDVTEQDWSSASEDYRAEIFGTAHALWAAGWRKKPSRDELADMLTRIRVDDARAVDGLLKIDAHSFADAILALMNGPTETGEKE